MRGYYRQYRKGYPINIGIFTNFGYQGGKRDTLEKPFNLRI